MWLTMDLPAPIPPAIIMIFGRLASFDDIFYAVGGEVYVLKLLWDIPKRQGNAPCRCVIGVVIVGLDNEIRLYDVVVAHWHKICYFHLCGKCIHCNPIGYVDGFYQYFSLF